MKISSRFNPYLKTGVFVILASVLVLSFSFVSNMFTKAVGPTANDDTIIVNSYQSPYDPIAINIADLISNDTDITGLNFQITSVTNGFVNVDSGIIEFYPDDLSLPMRFNYKMSENGEVTSNIYRLDDHYYHFVNNGLKWEEAFLAAENATLVVYGRHLNGYLVEINSAEEDLFLTQYISESAWTSGNDIENEGQWYWGKGEIPGKLFWQGYGPGDSSEPGSGIEGVYNNWQGIEPNDEGGEDCLVIDYASYDGAWNDLPCDLSRDYIIEFEDPTPDPVIESNEATVDISFLSGDLSCTVNGMTAEWTGSILDVYCGSDYIENNGANEITLTGVASGYITFYSNYDGFETLNLNNLTENTPIGDHWCGAGIGCIYLHLNNTDKLDVNMIGDNQIRDMDAEDVGELNLVGSGSLDALSIQAWGSGDNIFNLNTNIYLLTMPHFRGDILIAEGGTLNILGGNLIIEGVVDSNYMSELVYANDINITDNANVIIDVLNINTTDDMNIFYFENSITFGDKIIGTKDGVEIDDLYDLDNYIVGADSSTLITFGAPVVVDPTDPISPDGSSPELGVPDGGKFGESSKQISIVIIGSAIFLILLLTRQLIRKRQ